MCQKIVRMWKCKSQILQRYSTVLPLLSWYSVIWSRPTTGFHLLSANNFSTFWCSIFPCCSAAFRLSNVLLLQSYVCINQEKLITDSYKILIIVTHTTQIILITLFSQVVRIPLNNKLCNRNFLKSSFMKVGWLM